MTKVCSIYLQEGGVNIDIPVALMKVLGNSVNIKLEYSIISDFQFDRLQTEQLCLQLGCNEIQRQRRID